MEFQIFRFTWMLFIHRIHIYPVIWPLSCSYSFQFSYSQVTPRYLKICYGAKPRPTWSIQVTLTANKDDLFYDDPNFLDVLIPHQNRQQRVCKADIYECPPSSIPVVGCYCTSNQHSFELNSNNLIYSASLNITVFAEFWHSKKFLIFKYDDNRYHGTYSGSRRVTVIEAVTCFNFGNGVTPKVTANVGDVWKTQGTLSIVNSENSTYLSEIRVKQGTLLFCTIDITDCPPKDLPTRDIICYCGGKQLFDYHYVYYLNISATARESQSQDNLTAQLISASGDSPTTSIIGTLPTITQAISTKLKLIIIACLGGFALSLIGGILFCYITKKISIYRDRRLPPVKIRDTRLPRQPSEHGRSTQETSKREQLSFETSDSEHLSQDVRSIACSEIQRAIGTPVDPTSNRDKNSPTISSPTIDIH